MSQAMDITLLVSLEYHYVDLIMHVSVLVYTTPVNECILCKHWNVNAVSNFYRCSTFFLLYLLLNYYYYAGFLNEVTENSLILYMTNDTLQAADDSESFAWSS